MTTARREERLRPSILMLIGIITGMLSSVGEAVSLFVNLQQGTHPVR